MFLCIFIRNWKHLDAIFSRIANLCIIPLYFLSIDFYIRSSSRILVVEFFSSRVLVVEFSSIRFSTINFVIRVFLSKIYRSKLLKFLAVRKSNKLETNGRK